MHYIIHYEHPQFDKPVYASIKQTWEEGYYLVDGYEESFELTPVQDPGQATRYLNRYSARMIVELHSEVFETLNPEVIEIPPYDPLPLEVPVEYKHIQSDRPPMDLPVLTPTEYPQKDLFDAAQTIGRKVQTSAAVIQNHLATNPVDSGDVRKFVEMSFQIMREYANWREQVIDLMKAHIPKDAPTDVVIPNRWE